MLGNLAMSMVLARHLDPSEYGRFYLALSSVVIFAVLSVLGMDQAIVRAAAGLGTRQYRAELMVVINRCLLIAMMGAVAFAALSLLLGNVIPVASMFGGAANLALVTAWAVVATLQMQLAESYRALGNLKLANVFGGIRSSGILNAAIPLAGMIGFAWGGALSFQAALSVMLATTCLITLCGYLAMPGSIQRGEPDNTSNPPHWRALLGIGAPLWLAAVAATLYSQGFLWVASTAETERGLALLAAAQRTALVLIAPTTIVNAVLPPLVARLWSSGETKRLQRMVQAVAAVATIPSLLTLIAVASAGRNLLGVMLGEYYSDAYAALLIICVGVFADVATGAWQLVLAMTGNGKKLLYVTLSGTALFLCAVPLTTGWSVNGVPLAWAGSTIVMNIIGLSITRRSTGLSCHARLGREDIEAIRTAGFRRLGSLGRRA